MAFVGSFCSLSYNLQYNCDVRVLLPTVDKNQVNMNDNKWRDVVFRWDWSISCFSKPYPVLYRIFVRKWKKKYIHAQKK